MGADEGTEPATSRPGRGGSLTVLGCDGSYPGPGGAGSGYLVRAAGVTVWMDAGPGTFAALQLVVDPASVDAVLLSHEHPDHWSDVDSFAVWLRGARPGAPVPVYAPPGLRARSYFAEDPVLAWHEAEPSESVVVRPREREADGADPDAASFAAEPSARGLHLSFFRTDHGPPTLAVRIEHRTVLGYTADTGPGWSPAALGPGVDLLLCEATYTREHEGEGRHLSGRQAGLLAVSAGAGRLLLTHRRPSTDPDALAREAADAFGGRVEQAAAGRASWW